METKSKIITLQLPEENIGSVKVFNLNASRSWDAQNQQSVYKGCWLKGPNGELYELNVSVIIETDTLRLKSIRPYLRRVELNKDGQTE